MINIKKNIVAPKGFNFKYVVYRIMRPILKLNYKLYKLKNKNTPWLAQESIEFLKQRLNKKMKGLEYGSGFSTTFLAERSESIVSIEHNKEWFDLINNMLKERKIDNIQYIFSGENDPCEKSMEEIMKNAGVTGKYPIKENYASYINQVNQFEDNYFDYVIIDGRARVETFLASYPKLKKGGFIILDNAERTRYTVLHDFMKGHEKIFHTTGLTDTVIWFK